VSQSAITLHLQRCPGTAGERLASLQTALKCGTNCGSCLPQLKKLVAAVPVAAAVAS
jgi:assimilatory nitrate reductase catalytic subunit